MVEVEWGGGADEAKLEQILKADTDKKIKAVAVVHNETTTGVTSDIGQIRQVGCFTPTIHSSCDTYRTHSSIKHPPRLRCVKCLL